MRQDDDLWYGKCGKKGHRLRCRDCRRPCSRPVSMAPLLIHQEIDHHQTRQELVHTGRNPMVHQMNQEIHRLASVFYQAAAEAWAHRNVTRQRRHSFDRLVVPEQRPEHDKPVNHHRRASNNNDAYMEQFGIPWGKDDDEEEGDGYSAAFEDQHHRNGNNFVVLPRSKRKRGLPGDDGRGGGNGHAFVANLDVYLQNLYSYFYHRGLTPILCKGVVELVTLLLTLLLSVFLFAYVDWSALAQCHDEATCRADFGGYVLRRPLRQWSWWHGTVIIYIILFCAYTVLRVLALVETVESARAARLVYENRLGISHQKLLGGAVDWNADVINKLLDGGATDHYRISITPLDALVITNRIMRKENYLIAMFNRGLLDLKMPAIFAVVTDTCYCPSIEVSKRIYVFYCSTFSPHRTAHCIIIAFCHPLSGASTFAS
jgi:hypothetical protein